MTVVPRGLPRCPRLRKLSFDFTPITDLPPDFAQLSGRLQILLLSSPALREVPPVLPLLNNLYVLSFEQTQLTSLPMSLLNLTRLTWIRLGGTPLASFPPVLATLARNYSLRVIDYGIWSPSFPLSDIETAIGAKCYLNHVPADGLRCGWQCKRASPQPALLVLSANATGVIQSNPGFATYDNLTSCSWTLQAPPGFRLRMHFAQFELEVPVDTHQLGCADFVMLEEGDTRAYNGTLIAYNRPGSGLSAPLTLCGQASLPNPSERSPQPTDVFTSASNVVSVLFRTDTDTVYAGFQLVYTVIP